MLCYFLYLIIFLVVLPFFIIQDVFYAMSFLIWPLILALVLDPILLIDLSISYVLNGIYVLACNSSQSNNIIISIAHYNVKRLKGRQIGPEIKA